MTDLRTCGRSVNGGMARSSSPIMTRTPRASADLSPVIVQGYEPGLSPSESSKSIESVPGNIEGKGPPLRRLFHHHMTACIGAESGFPLLTELAAQASIAGIPWIFPYFRFMRPWANLACRETKPIPACAQAGPRGRSGTKRIPNLPLIAQHLGAD